MAELDTFKIWEAVVNIFLLGGLGGLFVKAKWLDKDSLNFLIKFLIKIAVPCLIFSVFIKESELFQTHRWQNFVGVSIIIAGLGFLLGGIGNFFIKNKNLSREFLLLITFQNCGYLPMNLSLFLFPKEIHLKFLTYIFLYLLGFNFLMWSLGSLFVSREKFNLKYFFTPPFLSVLVSFLLIKLEFHRFIPQNFLEVTNVLGQTAFPLSMLVLGAILFEQRRFTVKNLNALMLVALLKLLILPFVTFLLLIPLKINIFLKLFILMQSSMPSAASLPIIAAQSKGYKEFVSQGVFLTTFLSLFTIPLWLNIFKIYVING